MAYDKDLLNIMYARTGIRPASLEYDIELSDFINRFFQEINRLGIRINAYGGTPLNRGFFGERQRLSLDLDLATSTRIFNANVINIRDIIRDMGYKEVRSELLENSFVARVSKGENAIKVEIRKKDLTVKTEYVTLLPLLDYYGLPLVATKVPSYEFEYLLASKLHAFARRMIYRDLYDSFTGLQIAKDMQKLAKYVKAIDRKLGIDIVSEISEKISKGDYAYKQMEDTVYEELVPLRYREDRKVMANFVRLKVDGLRKK